MTVTLKEIDASYASCLEIVAQRFGFLSMQCFDCMKPDSPHGLSYPVLPIAVFKMRTKPLQQPLSTFLPQKNP